MFIGLLEVSYAGSALIGIPLIALSIDQISWRAPFFIFSFGALIGFIIIRITIDEDHDIRTHQTSYNLYHDLWQPVIKARPSFGMVGFFFFSGMAIENLFVVYGPWLETRFGLNVVALGRGIMRGDSFSLKQRPNRFKTDHYCGTDYRDNKLRHHTDTAAVARNRVDRIVHRLFYF
jgi:MFS family permease